MEHAVYVGVAYGISAIALAGLVGWILVDSRARSKELERLEQSGITRRSARTGAKPS